jgi:serine/threonine-protein kinase ULK/ATG1
MYRSVSLARPIINKKNMSKFESSDIYRIGSYEIFLDKQIGIGGYSVVYIGRCIDDSLSQKYHINKTKQISGNLVNNIVAIKKIIVKGLSYKHQKMITEEVSIMKRIKETPHVNIVTCYDIIDDLDTIYIVMEYCDGGDLSKLIGLPMKEESAKHYFSQLISGVKYLEENKIIHRDIKPKNILLTDNRLSLKICDFGLAKNKAGLSRVYTVCGSPLYMAPEMFRDKYYNDTVDIWSIGIILYEMLFGMNPLSKIKDYHELESFMVNNKENIAIPPKNNKVSRHVSSGCISLLKTILVKDSEQRISLRELYNHKWLKVNSMDDIPEQMDDNDIDFSDYDKAEGDLVDSNSNPDIMLFKFDD